MPFDFAAPAAHKRRREEEEVEPMAVQPMAVQWGGGKENGSDQLSAGAARIAQLERELAIAQQQMAQQQHEISHLRHRNSTLEQWYRGTFGDENI